MTTMIIISLVSVLAPFAINGVIAYFRPGAPAQETKVKEVKLAPANPWDYADTQDPEHTAPSNWAHVDSVPVCNTAIDSVHELPEVDVTPVTLAQDATFTDVENVIGETDVTAGSVVTVQPIRIDDFEFVPAIPDMPVAPPTDIPDVPIKTPPTPDVPVTPPTDTPDVPPTIPPTVPVPTVDTPDPEIPVTVSPVDEPTPDPAPLTLVTETVLKKEVIVELQPKPQIYWEEWKRYEKSVIVTDFAYRFDAVYTSHGFIESAYKSTYEYHFDTVADYYRNSIGDEYFAESTTVSECFFEEYSFAACDFSDFSGDFSNFVTTVSEVYSLHSETISETISEGSYFAITK